MKEFKYLWYDREWNILFELGLDEMIHHTPWNSSWVFIGDVGYVDPEPQVEEENKNG